MELNADDIVLEDFADIWFTNCQARYRVCKGGRDTGKSFNIVGFEPLFKILDDTRRNILMIRANDKDNANSTFAQLKKAAHIMGLYPYFKFTQSPYKIVRKATGQTILFAGMNDVQNITSTTFETGYWTDIYFEEASQLKSFDDFQVVDGSLRLPAEIENDGLFCQITFCMNAWDVGHWIYDIFYKDYMDDNVGVLETQRYQFAEFPDFNIGFGFGLALHTSTYLCNTHRSKDKDASIAIMKAKAYDYYKVAALGCWGNLSDKTYSYWTDDLIQPDYVINGTEYNALAVGIDFGMSNGEGKIKYSEDNAKRLGSANVMELIGISDNWNKIVPINEYFDSNEGRTDENKKTSVQIQFEMISTLKLWMKQYNIYDTISVFVDCADSGGFIDGLVMEARRQGLINCVFIPSSKIPILTRVYFENIMMAYGCITPSMKCQNLIREIKNARKAKDGRCREDYDDHAINAFEYAWIPLRKKLKRWKDFKDPNESKIDFNI